ncbi:hypothetical protein K443DRAFT_328593 [Laccaria amethystina LaAM-08-1]|uniref:Uncharacterized protein n=1 Tax=Laccaria amethystina LaAM-08-1 TaxID=1095629 RepID=A0A0C9XCI1_9AGAR|nr:hypothetical protein K443DRAFT_328593 [Laccaria amethystina LaAM-08-1]
MEGMSPTLTSEQPSAHAHFRYILSSRGLPTPSPFRNRGPRPSMVFVIPTDLTSTTPPSYFWASTYQVWDFICCTLGKAKSMNSTARLLDNLDKFILTSKTSSYLVGLEFYLRLHTPFTNVQSIAPPMNSSINPF